MSEFWNNRVKNLSPYVPGEQPKDKKLIKLNTNENPYPPSLKVIEAVQKAADDSLRLYPDPECTMLRETIAACYNVKPDQVFASNGSDEILAFAFGAFFESAGVSKGSGKAQPVLFPDITYSFYPVYCDLWDIRYQTVPLCEDFTINTEDYKKNGAENCAGCGGVILPNPNAPTGIALEAEKILSLADFLEKQKKVIIIDEAYAAFGAKSVVPYINKYPNLLTVHTLSKYASLAGLRVGFAIGSEKLIEALKRMRDCFNSYTLDRMAQAGAAAAVADTAYYSEINGRVIKTRQRVTKELCSSGFTVLPSSANFIFIKFPGVKGNDVYSALREKGILARHFNKERIKDFLRVTIGTDDDMDIFLDCCKEIIKTPKRND